MSKVVRITEGCTRFSTNVEKFEKTASEVVAVLVAVAAVVKAVAVVLKRFCPQVEKPTESAAPSPE